MAIVRQLSRHGNPRLDDLWQEFAEFLQGYRESFFNKEFIEDIELQTVYNKLMITVGSCAMSIPEIERNRLRVYDFITTHYPTLLKRLDIQNRIRTMPDKELQSSGTQTTNRAQSPTQEYNINTTDENISVQSRDKMINEISINDALIKQSLILDDMHWDIFIERIRRLFKPIIIPVMMDFHIWEREINTDEEED